MDSNRAIVTIIRLPSWFLLVVYGRDTFGATELMQLGLEKRTNAANFAIVCCLGAFHFLQLGSAIPPGYWGLNLS